MNSEKAKLYSRLNDAHDSLYAAIEITEDLPAGDRTSRLLTLLDGLNERMESIMENQWWRKEN